ncbi:MAG TPA: aldehyde dehydrogenase family protein, partial [Candidatus Elarobacter sp.]|nr:aldehyde dehydrogenase family protein [Candidatus Elarobacter sp.]
FARVRGYVDRAQRERIGMLGRSARPDDLPAGGFYVEPMVFGPVPEPHELAREEVFGPVLAALPFDDEHDAIRLANATPYGLVAGVWTENGSRQTRVARAMRAGQVFINCYGAGGGIELPFGGFKRSGHGRGKGFAAMLEFSTLQTITQKYA